MKKEINLTLIPELAGALGSYKLSDEQMARFTQDPNCFLAELNMEPDGLIDIQTLENSEDEVHLTLPYYSGVEEQTAAVLSDESLESISGGEIVVNLIFGLAIAGAVAGTVYAVAKDAAISGRNEAFEEITGEEFPDEGGK